jgi:hypothetical protein
MTQLGEGPMTYYKLQIEKQDKSWWLTAESTPFSVAHLQETKERWEAKGRKTRILKVEVTEVTE